jgi:hypothetical protein
MDDPTIPANDRFIQYEYVRGFLTFNYDFPVHTESSVAVYIGNARLMFPQDYTVTISENFDGGTVTLLSPPQANSTITIVGDTLLTRTEYYGDEPVVNPHALDSECEKHIMRLQQLNTKILGCLKNNLKETEKGNTILPPTEERKGKIAAWDGISGALTFFGDGAMDEIYLKRGNNVSDLANVEKARDNLHIIDGRELVNNGTPILYRRTVEFNKVFSLTNHREKTLIAINVMVTNMGQGIPLVINFSDNTIWARTLRVMGNLSLAVANDGSLLIAGESSPKGYSFTFEISDWGVDNHITIPYSRHAVADDNTLVVAVKDSSLRPNRKRKVFTK